MNNSEKHELLMLMEKCGHFLYHRRGGKRGQGRILKILLREGEMTQKELQDYLGIQAGSMSEIIGKLENSGLLCKTKDENDRRKVKLKITNEGKIFFEENLEKNIEEEKKLFDSLDDNEQKELLELMNKLLGDWQLNYDKSLFNHRKDENIRRCRKDD